MSDTGARTIWLELTEVDPNGSAVYTSATSGNVLTVPFDQWVEDGRLSFVEITVQAQPVHALQATT